MHSTYHNSTIRELRDQQVRFAPRTKKLEQVERAEGFYRSSEPLEELIDPACVPALWAMTSIYRSTLDKIRRDPRRVVGDTRVALSPVQKSSIALLAKWRSLRSRNVAS